MNCIYRICSLLAILILMAHTGCRKDKVPVLSTVEVTDITTTSARSGGKIADEGSGSIIDKGVCWSLNDNPVTGDNKTSEGGGAASFFSTMDGLTDGTGYFVRAYATNSSGTGYGKSISFTTSDPAKREEEMIQNYLNDNPTLAFKLKSSGLYYLDVIIGTGAAPLTHDTAYVKYVGKFLDGTIFDSNSSTNPLVFPVNEGLLIAGFEEGISYMKQGGKALFLMPSKLGYGPEGYYTIPGYTPLLYEVDLLKVKTGAR